MQQQMRPIATLGYSRRIACLIQICICPQNVLTCMILNVICAYTQLRSKDEGCFPVIENYMPRDIPAVVAATLTVMAVPTKPCRNAYL